ncbi:MAG TPA: ABC transporter substrate-binding protein [Candidatus Corynebacterium gallistercoris]|uniref:ABC transporter substrate-binding protein n=1 Tax=Candidatus Corynebacterium gallistercoris TaxID=2838530 RepID=A0A9D1UR16_9CORY|nr:ABC transporter substrate-binding protein [Candidatus Corynebacterium gallistercoris]
MFASAKSKSVVAALSAASLLLTGCGLGTLNTDTNTTANAEQTSFAEALEDFHQATATVPDPREITGLSTSAEVGDVVPVTPQASPELPVTLTDADDHHVTVTDTSRIIPLDLYGTTSRTLAGLGLRESIVGRATSSQEPSLRDLPVVTQGSHNINVEAVLNLNPSLVMVDHSIGPSDAIAQIRQAGVTVVVLDPSRGIDDIAEDIAEIAHAVGLDDEGEELERRSVAEKDQAIAAVREIAPANPMRLAFIYARGTGGVFFILGPDSGTSDLFNAVFGSDAAADAHITVMTPANAEALAELNPEAIVMMERGLESTGGVEGMLENPGVAETTAGQKERIVAIPDSQSLSFGPQTGEMILAFAEALYAPR